MFDVGFSELVVIGVVSLIVVGPKDLPNMFRTVGKYVGKAKGMAREFQRSMEEAADASGFKDLTDDLKGVTKGLEDVNKFTNPGFGTAKEVKKRFDKIVEAKESGEPIETADGEGANSEGDSTKVVDIVDDNQIGATAKPKTKAGSTPKRKAAPKPKTAAKSGTAKPKAPAKPKTTVKPKAKAAAKPKAKPRAKAAAKTPSQKPAPKAAAVKD